MRIAYFSPLSPIKVGVSDYSEELLPLLNQYADIDLYIDNYQPSSETIKQKFNTYHYLTIEDKLKNYDIILYHIGNNPAHTYIYNSLMKYPGVVVLHDYVLHHLALKALVDSGNWEQYIDEMQDCYGDEGVLASIQILKGYGKDTLYFLYPFNERLFAQAAGIIVHSDYLRKIIQKNLPHLPVTQVNQGIKLWKEEEFDPAKIKSKLGVREDTFLIASFGLLTPSKRPETMLRAFKAFHKQHRNSILLLVGKVANNINLEELIKKFSLKKSVRITGYVDFDTFQKYIQVSDVCLNLRYPSGGETSAALLRIMGCGKPAIVSNYSQFTELPDDCCIKVDLGRYEVPELAAYLDILWKDRNLRLKIGSNARGYVMENHSLTLSAQQYAECLGKFKPAMRKKQEAGQRKLLEHRRNYSDQVFNELMQKIENLNVSDDARNYFTPILSDLNIIPE